MNVTLTGWLPSALRFRVTVEFPSSMDEMVVSVAVTVPLAASPVASTTVKLTVTSPTPTSPSPATETEATSMSSPPPLAATVGSSGSRTAANNSREMAEARQLVYI